MVVNHKAQPLPAIMKADEFPPDEFFARGGLQRLESILLALKVARIFIVADAGAFAFSGAKAYFEDRLANVQKTFFSDFEPNPKLADVERGVLACRDCVPDLVVALGGGTAIDLAKMIAAFVGSEASCRDLAIGAAKLPSDSNPLSLVAIPTTAGTGSETTHFAVVYVDGEKYSVADQSLLPEYVIVDPQLTESLPREITAATGLDAFCQAIESIWAVGATDESIGYAETAARLALENLSTVVLTPTPAARAKMSRASHLAGKAINITKTTLPHAVSYAITSDFGIPHGEAVAMTLAAALQFNAGVTDDDCHDPRGAVAVRERIIRIQNILGAATIDQAGETIRELVRGLGCAASPREAGIIEPADISQIAKKVNVVRLGNNPRKTTPAILAQLLSDQATTRNEQTKPSAFSTPFRT